MSRKVLGWNINQRSGLGKEIPEFVLQELLEQDADVIVLVYCTIKIPKVAEGNPQSCMRNFPIIADAFGISLRPQ